MNINKYSKTLLQFREKELTLLSLLGKAWIILKIILITIGVILVSQPDTISKNIGLVLLGYTCGVIMADVRSMKIGKVKWSFQKQLLDWSKIEKLASETTKK